MAASDLLILHYILLRLCEMHYALLLFFFSLFCQPYPGLWDCKSVFLIIKISQYGESRWWVQLFPMYPCKNWYKNWYLHFYRTHDHQIWQAGTPTGFASNETIQAGAGDVITSRSHDKLKTYYLHYHSAFGHITWQDGNLPSWAPAHKVTWPFITWSWKITWQT